MAAAAAAAGEAAMAVEPAAGLVDPEVDVPLTPPPPVSQRYYSASRFWTDIKGELAEDQFVLQHSNGLCVVGLAPSHPVRTSAVKRPLKVTFRDGILSNKPSGKKKIGASWMTEYSRLADIECADGSSYVVYACVRGNLYEVNHRLLDHPELLLEKGDTDGYVAIFMPKRDEKKTVTKELLTREQYDEKMAGR
mmetsp:Transcript_3256/g.9938  ORF Transcript_3256/g.9938 Transcript_3256/m.9938 type:complete len:193 (+) Transcript_3256:72-650(+)